MRQDRRRGDGQLPPARRQLDLRGPRPPRPGLQRPLSARRRPGQLRQHRRRQPRRPALHRGPPHRRRRGADGRPRRGRRRLPRQLRRLRAGARRPARRVPEPARQRLLRHRRGHGDQHPAAQHRRALQRLPASHQVPRRLRREAPRLRPGPGFPHRRHHHRAARGDQGSLPHRQGRLPPARPLGGGGSRPRHLADRRHRDPLPGAEGQADRAAGRAHQPEEDPDPRRRPRRERRGRPHRAGAARPHRRPDAADGDAVQGERPRDPLRPQHERADRRPHAAGLDDEGGAARLPRPPPRRPAAPLPLPAGEDRRPPRDPRGASGRLPQPRPRHRDHPHTRTIRRR